MYGLEHYQQLWPFLFDQHLRHISKNLGRTNINKSTWDFMFVWTLVVTFTLAFFPDCYLGICFFYHSFFTVPSSFLEITVCSASKIFLPHDLSLISLTVEPSVIWICSPVFVSCFATEAENKSLSTFNIFLEFCLRNGHLIFWKIEKYYCFTICGFLWHFSILQI